MSCREIAEQFKIGKTQAPNVVKNKACARTEYKNLHGKDFKNLKRENHQKYKAINTICYNWFKKYKTSKIYVSRPLLKGEAMHIKDLNSLNDFKASEGLLNKWKVGYGMPYQ